MTDDQNRVACCSCGQLRVTAAGDPDLVVACSCFECQRRTGSPFGLGAYYQRDQILTIDGDHKSFARGTASDRTLTTNFCPECGATVFWELEMRPEHIGVAVGCFADPQFPGPVRAVWAENSHHWVAYPDDLPVFEQAAT
ncbi:MAG: GFA family protein [Alphaproteobacteria bacterium]|nr:GFA family protein [Alphaproteobacteria bacterium]